jgi:hypothetical protein
LCSQILFVFFFFCCLFVCLFVCLFFPFCQLIYTLDLLFLLSTNFFSFVLYVVPFFIIIVCFISLFYRHLLRTCAFTGATTHFAQSLLNPRTSSTR